MSDVITLTGIVGTEPESITIGDGIPLVRFRLGSNSRRFDKTKNEWVDGGTNWYTVQAFRQLAGNAERSLSKGDSVIVVGKLKVRAWTKEDRSGIAVDVDAEAIGHNLLWGRSSFERTISRSPAAAEAPASSGAAATDDAAPAGWTLPGAASDDAYAAVSPAGAEIEAPF